MSFDLPAAIAAYFKADESDGDAVAACFTKNARVIDEGHTYDGLAAIRKWKTETSVKYTYTSELLSLEQEGSSTVVTSKLTGNFPGSPVDLRYHFELDGDKIASLKIIP